MQLLCLSVGSAVLGGCGLRRDGWDILLQLYQVAREGSCHDTQCHHSWSVRSLSGLHFLFQLAKGRFPDSVQSPRSSYYDVENLKNQTGVRCYWLNCSMLPTSVADFSTQWCCWQVLLTSVLWGGIRCYWLNCSVLSTSVASFTGLWCCWQVLLTPLLCAVVDTLPTSLLYLVDKSCWPHCFVLLLTCCWHHCSVLLTGVTSLSVLSTVVANLSAADIIALCCWQVLLTSLQHHCSVPLTGVGSLSVLFCQQLLLTSVLPTFPVLSTVVANLRAADIVALCHWQVFLASLSCSVNSCC